MAKVLFGGGIAEMRRSLEGNTFSRNKGGSYVRQRVRPTNPQTPDQIGKREALSQLAKRWGVTLSEGQRTAWVDFAEINPIIDVLGQPITLAGIQAYIRINQRLLIANQSIIDEPPLNQDVTQLSAASAIFDVGAGNVYNIFFSPSTIPLGLVQIFATPQLSPGISFIKNRIRLIEPALGVGAPPIDFLPQWINKFGSLPAVGAKIGGTIRLINPANGAFSVPLRIDTIVVST